MTGLAPVAAAAAPVAGAALGGLYLAFDLAVLPALARPAVRVGDREPSDRAAETMRAINVAIVRPSFLALLLATPALAVAAAALRPGPLTVAAAVLQLAGLAITVAVNVPLNDRLARDRDAAAWARFLGPWRHAHRVRTAAVIGAALLGATAGLDTSGTGAS